MTSEAVISELAKCANSDKAANLQWFFKTGPGEYGEGDIFLGAKVPEVRRVSRQFRRLKLGEISKLIDSEIHEHRQCGLFILVLQFEKADLFEQKKIYDLYLVKAKQGKINNWDLIDATTPQIVGGYLADKDRGVLVELADTDDLWLQRISIMATFYFIKRQGQYDDTLLLAEKLLHHEHDLIHKAVGWMLREVGNRDRAVEEIYLREHYKIMPRTMLRYAIEKFPENLRQDYLKGNI